MAISGRKVIDGDGHVMEPHDLWTSRMDHKKWGDAIPVPGIRSEESESAVSSMIDRISEVSGIPASAVLDAFQHNAEKMGKTGGYDGSARLEDMDRAGIDVAVIYPSTALFYGPRHPVKEMQNPQFVLACQQAYNDWLVDYCSADGDRLFGIGAVPLQSIDLAIKEAKRIKDIGLRGVYLRPSAYIDELPLSNPVYDPFWAACQDLDLSVSFHPGVNIDTPGACTKFGLVYPDFAISNFVVTTDFGGSGLGQAIGNAADMIVTMGRIIMGGVCERHPRLRFIFLESGGGWCATQLERMDEQVEEFPLDGYWLSLKPSDYFRRQCYVSFDAGEWNLASSAQWIGADRFLGVRLSAPRVSRQHRAGARREPGSPHRGRATSNHHRQCSRRLCVADLGNGLIFRASLIGDR